MTTRIYVDWSGDPGFRFQRGSSELLVIGAAVAGAQEIDLSEFRREIGLAQDHEFHYTHSSRQIRSAFFRLLPQLQFDGANLRVNKRVLGQEYRRIRGPELLAKVIAHCIDGFSVDVLHQAVLIFDGKRIEKPLRRAIRRETSKRLRKHNPPIHLKRVAAIPAHRSDGLQLVDMLLGGIRQGALELPMQNVTFMEWPPQ